MKLTLQARSDLAQTKRDISRGDTRVHVDVRDAVVSRSSSKSRHQPKLESINKQANLVFVHYLYRIPKRSWLETV